MDAKDNAIEDADEVAAAVVVAAAVKDKWEYKEEEDKEGRSIDIDDDDPRKACGGCSGLRWRLGSFEGLSMKAEHESIGRILSWPG